uniref:Uncharacterized protein n=1 Tax=Anguilla anguilla TaxID=7936 RepID=A0A0E9TPI7_ANGAN
MANKLEMIIFQKDEQQDNTFRGAVSKTLFSSF